MASLVEEASIRILVTLDSLESTLYFLDRIAENNGTAVRAAHRVIRFRELLEEPFHFRSVERRVYFDGRMA